MTSVSPVVVARKVPSTVTFQMDRPPSKPMTGVVVELGLLRNAAKLRVSGACSRVQVPASPVKCHWALQSVGSKRTHVMTQNKPRSGERM
jgi:hypothetical protein